MGDVIIEKLCEAHWRAWLGVKPDATFNLNGHDISSSDRNAMTAAIATLADNVSDEMVRECAEAGRMMAISNTDIRKALSAALRSLLQNE